MGFEKLQFNLLNRNEMVDKSKWLYLEALKGDLLESFLKEMFPYQF